MLTNKERVLLGIYNAYEQWDDGETACTKGCSSCCTQNVNMTAVEGEIIYHFINEQDLQGWLAEKLEQPRQTTAAKLTTNQYAKACIDGKEAGETEEENLNPCPFLENNECSIYRVRPFACRCFASTEKCEEGGNSVLPGHIISGATAIMQVIEHLGQREYWGNMLDVMLALGDLVANKKMAESLADPKIMDYARARLIAAQPLPGFLIQEEDQSQVQELLDTVFNTKIDGKSIEDILNGK